MKTKSIETTHDKKFSGIKLTCCKNLVRNTENLAARGPSFWTDGR